ncbi:MAG: L-seryl-tRNA(Sec) selenium transferase [bacterium]
MTQDPKSVLQQLPKVDKLLEDSRIATLLEHHSRSRVVEEIRSYLDSLRSEILSASRTTLPEYDALVERFVRDAEKKLLPGLRRSINGAGIILHTALGRAPLASVAQQALMIAVDHYSTLAINLETGKRGDRNAAVEKLLKAITGAEAAVVVNNNAAATLLILNTLAEGKEVIVSRGELVEIGGSFRIPDVMKRSGAKLVEVGTTNRTHLKDYKNAITPEAGIILKVHQSNYRIIGFTSQVEVGDLASLAHQHNLKVVDDIGSGALVDFSRWGLPKEPVVQESVAAGADVTCFSGDKLLGGPQCGIIVGKKEVIEKIKGNQLMRALRCDKLTFAVLEATLLLFLDEAKLLKRHPVMKMLTMPQEEIKRRCTRLKQKLARVIGEQATMSVQQDSSEVGSGSLAAMNLPTWVLSLEFHTLSADLLAKKLRQCTIPIIGRIKENKFLLDGRTIRDDEFELIMQSFRELATTLLPHA